MCALSGFQLSGSAPEAYQRYGVVAIGTAKAQELVALAALQPGARVLDVACGTGVVARQAAHAVGTTGQVTGLDINEGMLHVARTVPPPVGAPITWREGSVMALPFPDATFDTVLCQWGLEFFPDRAQGLRDQLVLFQVYHNFVLPHASSRQRLPLPEVTHGHGSAKVWRPCTPAVAAGLTDHVWSLKEVLFYRVPPWPQPQTT